MLTSPILQWQIYRHRLGCGGLIKILLPHFFFLEWDGVLMCVQFIQMVCRMYVCVCVFEQAKRPCKQANDWVKLELNQIYREKLEVAASHFRQMIVDYGDRKHFPLSQMDSFFFVVVRQLEIAARVHHALQLCLWENFYFTVSLMLVACNAGKPVILFSLMVLVSRL